VRALFEHGLVEILQVLPELPGEEAPVRSAPAVRARAHPFSVRGALEMAQLAERSGCDVVHCLHFPTPLPARRCVVVTMHDLIPLVMRDSMPRDVHRAVYRFWNARAAKIADRIVVPSRHTAGDVVRLFPRARSKVAIVPEGVDKQFLQPQPPRHNLAHRDPRPYVLAFASERPHKGLSILLSAYARFAASGREERLVLVGSPHQSTGPVDSQLDDRVRSRMAFTGPVADEELRSLYADAQAFILPSMYEGFGLPVLEAMAVGTPVVCSDAASLPEVAGEAAQLFHSGDERALADALVKVLEDRTLRTRLSEAGMRRARAFSWEATARATAAVYEAAMASWERDRISHGARWHGRPDRLRSQRPA
jgi:glycosyltransferase involved in cell wall biosynthesis